MKKICLLLVIIFCVSLSVKTNAQKITLLSGDLSKLKGQTKLNIEYVYDEMTVGKKTEAEYIKEKVEKYNKDEAGKGDKWLENWKGDRKSKFQPKFEELLNKYLSDAKVNASPNNSDAKYTLIVKTDFTEPGFNIGVMRQPAYISTTIIIIETAAKTNEIGKITIEKSPGQDVVGNDYETGYRLQEAYAKCGKELAKFLLKKAFK